MPDLILSSAAKKFLKNAESTVYDRIMKKIDELANDPFPRGVERVVGRPEKTFRIRAGDYRVLYSVFFEKSELLINNIDKRGRAYE